MKRNAKQRFYQKVDEIQQETRRYDEKTKKTILMRVKEDADDYRFSQTQTLYQLYIDDEWKERIRKEIPELPDARKKRYVEEYGLPEYDAEVLTATKEMADFFEETVESWSRCKTSIELVHG